MLNKSYFRWQAGGARAVLFSMLALALTLQAAREPRSRRGDAGGPADYAATRLLKTGQDLLLAGEEERGVEVMKKILDQFPDSDIRYQAYLTLGKHYIDVNKQQEAVGYLNFLRELETPDKKLIGEPLDIFLEGLFLMGKAYFQMRQYNSAFPVLRKITNNYPNTVWANEAYYFIGMSHFGQENWIKAIEALSKVGTYIDPDSPTIEYVEAGRRFYVKVADGDLPVRYRLNEEVTVEVTTKNGDKETITGVPLAGDSEVFIGSLPTVIGPPTPGNGSLEVIGGDSLTVRYVDANTQSGQSNIPRQKEVRIVSSASLNFTRGDLETRATGAYLGQPVFVMLRDIDLDVSPKADKAQIRVISRFRQLDEEGEAGPDREFDLSAFLEEGDEEAQLQVRDELIISLDEQGQSPVHSGEFVGRIDVTAISDDVPVSLDDNILSCNVGDEIVVTYTDQLHINGTAPREITASLRVLSEIESAPRATQYVVSDPVIRAKKSLVEATAFLELGRIFKSMGLKEGAAEKCDEGLDLVNEIIGSGDIIPRGHREEAFRLKWELEIAKGNYAAAINTCRLFNRLYPNSPMVDQALLGIAEVKYGEEKYDEAIRIYKQIISLPHSQVKGQAQFRIAEAMEHMAKSRVGRASSKDAAIAQFKLVAERYPDSEFAGPSLGKLIDYYLETRDYARADDLLEQVFTDHPDVPWLDSMLLKWVLVAYRMGDFRKAHDKCSQLVFEYPTSDFAEKAKQILPKIKAKIE